MNRAPWQNPRIIYTLLFVFLSGAVAGAITMRFGFTPERHRSGPSWKEGGREISLQRFRTEHHPIRQDGEVVRFEPRHRLCDRPVPMR